MPEVTPFDSVATLLEQILAATQANGVTAQEQLQNAQASNAKLETIHDAQNATNYLLTQTNTFLQQVVALLRQLVNLEQQSLAVAQATLESSHRIEQLLGGTGPAVPTEMKVTYQFTVLKGAEEHVTSES